MFFSIDRNSPTPLATQIEARLRGLVLGGQLPAGARLMSIRQLAAQLAVSPNTVVAAYDRLAAEGLLFIQTTLHNPTGWGSSPANLHRLLMLAQRHGLLIAEDDVQGHFHPGQPTRLAALSGLDRVIYYSSFCKAVSPALRVGYIAAEPALLRALLREKIYQLLTGAALNELVFLELLAAGRWRKHLERLQRKLVGARNQCLRQLREAGLRIDTPSEGGLFLWASLPPEVDVETLVRDAYRNQILLVRGATFMADGAGDPHIRFNVAQSQQPRLASYLRERIAAGALNATPAPAHGCASAPCASRCPSAST